MTRDALSTISRSYYVAIAIVAAGVLGAMAYSFYSSYIMINKYAPLVDAAMEVKLEATTAHLWFEEKISGDRYESFDEIISHIDLAKWYCRAMLEGGRNPEGLFFPLTDPVLRREVAQTLEHLDRFLDITHKRYKAFETSGIGTDIDQAYDALFKQFILRIDNVETLLQQKIARDYSRYNTIQIFLILTIVVLSILAVTIQYRHDQSRRELIRELDRARQTAEKNEKWLKTTMNSMGDAVIITDHNGFVTYMNPVGSALTGWLLKDAKNRKMTEVFHIINEETGIPVDDPVNLVIRNNQVVGLANHTALISKTGKVWPISDSAAPIFDDHNNLTGVVVVFHEITAQKKAEEETRKLEAQLRQAFKMEAIGTLAGGIAHDFNNILAVILGNADMAAGDTPEGSPVRHNINEILKASGRAKELVKQILSFSRRGENKKEYHDLCDLVKESMTSLRATIPTSVKQEISLPQCCEGSGTGCATVRVDPTQIHQLLLNLCVNAVQAMDEKGTLEVGVESLILDKGLLSDRLQLVPGNYEHLYVSDTGPGIPPDIMDKIFDPFFTTKEVGEGTGMGLAVVHGIVEDHNGKITVESPPGRGTVFHIYLPGAGKEKTEIRPAPTLPLPGGTEHILFVDDEAMLASVGKRILESRGYTVTVKTDSLEALDLVKQNPGRFQLIITDQTMPNMTGAELAEELLRDLPGLPIILCTGYSSRIDKEKAMEIGITKFAAKPLDRHDILTLVRQALDEKK